MTSQQFFQTYAQYEPDIIKILTGKNIFDEDLLHHTNRATYRERCRALLPKVIDYYFSHPQPGERNRRRACRILRLYLQGLSECQIARELKLSQPTIHQYFTRIIGHLKAIALILYNRGA